YRSDIARHWARTGQPWQMAIAAEASWRAGCASALAGNHWSGSRLTYRHRACRMTQDHDDRPVTGCRPAGSGPRLAALPRMRAACPNRAGVVVGSSVILIIPRRTSGSGRYPGRGTLEKSSPAFAGGRVHGWLVAALPAAVGPSGPGR